MRFPRGQRAGKPFFINCNITDPHRPFYGARQTPAQKKKAARREDDGTNGDDPTESEGVVVPATPAEVPIPSFLEDVPELRREVAQYCSSIKRLDLSFAAVMKALDESGEAVRTCVVFMSDHGMSFPFSKATVYFNGTRSPVLLRWPGMGATQTREEMVSSVDLMPTLLELMHVAAPSGIDGRSWLPLLRAKRSRTAITFSPTSIVLAAGSGFPSAARRTLNRALMFHAWAGPTASFRVEAMSGLSYNALASAAKSDARIQARVDQLLHGTTLAFYDLTRDQDERRNEIDNPAYATEVARMKQQMLGYMERTNDPQLEVLPACAGREAREFPDGAGPERRGIARGPFSTLRQILSMNRLILAFALCVVSLRAQIPGVTMPPANDGKLRIIAFGAHPDDCELQVGGVGALWAQQGHHVLLVSVTNGDIGHWREAGGPLAQRRKREVDEAHRHPRRAGWSSTTTMANSSPRWKTVGPSPGSFDFGTRISCWGRGPMITIPTIVTRACWCRTRPSWSPCRFSVPTCPR
jgi:hypothetical protein